MEKNTTERRLLALDGLRGFAILLVFLNHVNPSALISALPFLDRLGIFSSGVTGVSFLFILSGFLMAYLYPQPQSSLQFLQKRYTRIFPLFLTMCAFMFLVHLLPNLSWYAQLFFLFLFAGVTHGIWVYGVKKVNKVSFSRTIFIFFLIIQLSVGLFYGVWIVRHPPAYFGSLPVVVREATIALVNGTLTFPLGDYIPMLDGVYWSLASEVLFYILYPILIAPLVLFISKTSRLLKILFLLSLLPFLEAVHLASMRILVLHAFQFVLFYYFATGIALGYLYRRHAIRFKQINEKLSGKRAVLPLICFFGLVLLITIINTFIPDQMGPWIRLIFAIPFTLVIATTLDEKTRLSQFFQSKSLVFLGTISYSIYLSHAAIIHIAEKLFSPHTFLSNILAILCTFIADIAVASLLYLLLEKPYFMKSITAVKKTQFLSFSQTTRLKAGSLFIGIIGIVIVAIFIGFQSNYNLFSAEISIPQDQLSISGKYIHSDTVILHENDKLTVSLFATENNLGLVAASVNHILPNIRTNTPQLLTFRIKEKGTNDYLSQVDYVLDEFRNVEFPFGFPVQAKSKGKTYIVEFFYTRAPTDEFIQIDTRSLKTVYQLQKVQVLTHPDALFLLIASKVDSVIQKKQALFILELLIPFCIVSIFSILKKRDNI